MLLTILRGKDHFEESIIMVLYCYKLQTMDKILSDNSTPFKLFLNKN